MLIQFNISKFADLEKKIFVSQPLTLCHIMLGCYWIGEPHPESVVLSCIGFKGKVIIINFAGSEK